jgi:hypothetical protein
MILSRWRGSENFSDRLNQTRKVESLEEIRIQEESGERGGL